MTMPAAADPPRVLPELALDIPPDFHEVPLETAIEDRVAAQSALLEDMGLRDTEQREGLGLYLEAIARTLAVFHHAARGKRRLPQRDRACGGQAGANARAGGRLALCGGHEEWNARDR